jgi:hypothetical protein
MHEAPNRKRLPRDRSGSLVFWLRKAPERKRDITVLRPASLPKGKRFETVADARRLSRARQEKIRTTDSSLAEMLRECGRNRFVCASPSCPKCCRRFRQWLIAQALEAHEKLHGSGSRIITIYLGTLPEGQLAGASLRKAYAALRQRLNRGGLGGAVLIGGTEMAYRAKQHDWVLHVHLLGLRLKRADRDQLKEAFRGSSIPKALKQQKIKSPAQQISYLQKFNTLHRPGVQRGNRRALAYPLPPAPFRELMAFYAKHEFAEFLFLFGARRRGARIVIDPAPISKSRSRLRADVPTRIKANATTRKRRRR